MARFFPAAALSLCLLNLGCSERKQPSPPAKPITEAQRAIAACHKEVFTAHLQASQELLKQSMAVMAQGGDSSPIDLMLRHEKEGYCLQRVDCYNPPPAARALLLDSCLAEEV